MKNILLTLILLLSANLYAENNTTIMVRVVKVSTEWIPFWNTSAWTKAAPIKESDSLKFFDVAYWEETKSIHFYEFPNDYDTGYCGGRDLEASGHTEEECIAHREQYAVMSKQVDSDIDLYRSYTITKAFHEFTNIIANRYPNSKHALSYDGHGGPGGKLFEGMVHPKHVQSILREWSEALGSKLAFVDMGGPCNKSSYADLKSFCPFSEYYIASDLANGGYQTVYDENFTMEYSNIDTQYHNFFANSTSTLEVLKKRIDLTQERYDHSLPSFTQLKEAGRGSYQQANYLFSCQKFKTFHDAISHETITRQSTDMKEYINDTLGANQTYLDLYDDIIIYQADSKDLIDWETTASGMVVSSNQFDTYTGRNESFEQKYPLMDFENNNVEEDNTPLVSANMMPEADMDGDGIVNRLDDDIDGDGSLNTGRFQELWYGSDIFVKNNFILSEESNGNLKQVTILEKDSIKADIVYRVLKFSSKETTLDVANESSRTIVYKNNDTTVYYQDKNILLLDIQSDGTSKAKLDNKELFKNYLPNGTIINIQNNTATWEIEMPENIEF